MVTAELRARGMLTSHGVLFRATDANAVRRALNRIGYKALRPRTKLRLTKENALAREALAIEWDKKPQSLWEERTLDIDEGSFKPAAEEASKKQK